VIEGTENKVTVMTGKPANIPLLASPPIKSAPPKPVMPKGPSFVDAFSQFLNSGKHTEVAKKSLTTTPTPVTLVKEPPKKVEIKPVAIKKPESNGSNAKVKTEKIQQYVSKSSEAYTIQGNTVIQNGQQQTYYTLLNAPAKSITTTTTTSSTAKSTNNSSIKLK